LSATPRKPSSPALRRLPSVGRVVEHLLASGAYGEAARAELAGLARQVVAELRAGLRAGGGEPPDLAAVCRQVQGRYGARRATRIPTMINATGVILHTGLGRALLPAAAAQAAARVAERYCGLAVDMATGGRGERDQVAEDLVCHLTGAEAATFACNNAAATMLVLAALCAGREVVVSRGQLIEIGGSFRLPEVMAQSGACLREVGTTNKTHRRDYAQAITAETAALLCVHMSNYRIVGFHQEVPLAELAALARERGIYCLHDLGSGALVDLREFGLEREPLVAESVQAGAEVVFFSGDKLIGGPQCGIIAGRGEAIARIRQHPLARAVRVGKLTLAALEATLQLFLDGERLRREHPVYRMLGEPAQGVRERAEKVAAELEGGGGLQAAAVPSQAELGSGSLPGQMIPSWAVELSHRSLGEEELARRLRGGEPPVLVRRVRGKVVADLRTVQPGELGDLVRRLREAGGDD